MDLENVLIFSACSFKNGKTIKEGGIAITIIPDSILENPSNKPIRDYLVSRCNILGIIGLPPYTFSPYAMEKHMH